MNFKKKHIVQILILCIILLTSAVPGLAAEIRRVPDYDLVEQGFLALTLDVEGAEHFRYTGQKNKIHVYRGKIKPGSKLKFVIKAALGGVKTLPITGRSYMVRIQIVAKKGSETLETKSYNSDNKSILFLNYIVPEGTEALEVNETFVLNNKSKNREYNKRIVERNKLVLSASDAGAAVAVGKTADSGGIKPIGNDSTKDDTSGDVKESKGISTGMLAGATVAVAAIAVGGFFFMKKRKDNQAANAEIAQKEKLRYQEEQWKQTQSTQQHMPLQVQNTVQQQADVTGMFGAVATMGNAAAAQPNFCSNCGTELEPGSRFCGNCGVKINN